MVARAPGRRAQQGKTMNDERFEAWWPRNPARLEMNPVAKEVARGIWRAAREDMLAEMRAIFHSFPPSENAPWYPDDSGEWVEVPDYFVVSPVSACTVVEVLLQHERHEKSWTPWRGIAAGFDWDHNATESGRIVAYKVVKP